MHRLFRAAVPNPSCFICAESFTTYPGEHVPLLLPCGHCFCSACVAFLEKRECPECRAKFGKKELPRNFALIDMIASISTVSGTAIDGEALVVDEKRKRTLSECNSDELLAMFQEKKKKENNTRLAELAVRQDSIRDEVDELKRAMVAAEENLVATRAKASRIIAVAQAELKRARKAEEKDVAAAQARAEAIRSQLINKERELEDTTYQIGKIEERESIISSSMHRLGKSSSGKGLVLHLRRVFIGLRLLHGRSDCNILAVNSATGCLEISAVDTYSEPPSSSSPGMAGMDRLSRWALVPAEARLAHGPMQREDIHRRDISKIFLGSFNGSSSSSSSSGGSSSSSSSRGSIFIAVLLRVHIKLRGTKVGGKTFDPTRLVKANRELYDKNPNKYIVMQLENDVAADTLKSIFVSFIGAANVLDVSGPRQTQAQHDINREIGLVLQRDFEAKRGGEDQRLRKYFSAAATALSELPPAETDEEREKSSRLSKRPSQRALKESAPPIGSLPTAINDTQGLLPDKTEEAAADGAGADAGAGADDGADDGGAGDGKFEPAVAKVTRVVPF